MPSIYPDQPIDFQGKNYTKIMLDSANDVELMTLHNRVWDNLLNDHDPMLLKRRRKWKSHTEAVDLTWEILGVYNGDIAMTDTKATKTEKPTPGCYSTELVKRPSRRMFMRIKKVGEPNKSQRPFAWPSFKNGMTLIGIKEDPNLHAGKISFWMRQKPPLIELEDIADAKYEKELAAWYVSHGLTDPTAAKKAKAEQTAKDKAERAAAKVAKDKVKAAEKAEKAKAVKAKADEKAKDKAAKAKAAATAKAAKAKAAPTKAKAKAA